MVSVFIDKKATLFDQFLLQPLFVSARIARVLVEKQVSQPIRKLLYVAESDGIVKGFQTIEPFGAYTPAFDHVGIIGTFVGLSFQKQGIGKTLFQASFTAARAKGFEKLFAFVRSGNTAGLRAYLGQGFEQVGIAKKHAKIDGKYIDQIVIERFL